MEKNMSNLDRLIRVAVALVLIWLNVSGMVTGILAIVAWVIVAIFVVTSTIGFCPLYKILGISTKKK